MPITASAGQQAATPIRDGGPQVQSVNFSLSSAGATHAAVDISSTNLITVTATKFGTPTNDCSLTLQVSVDGGTNFRDFATLSNADIVGASGLARTYQVKATHARLILTVGTMGAGNGFNTRFFV